MRILFPLQGLHSVSVEVLAEHKYPLPAGLGVVCSNDGWSFSNYGSDRGQQLDWSLV